MVQKLEQQLKEVGSKLESPPSTKVALLKLLEQAATCLSEIKQSPTISILESMQSFLKGIDKPELLKHQDRDVNFLVATCICEINRITSPEEPFDDECLKVLVEKYTTETLAEGIKRSLCIKDPGALKDHGSTLEKLLLHEVRVQGAFKGYAAANA